MNDMLDRIVPLWHSTTLREAFNCNYQFNPHHLADHGGAGVSMELNAAGQPVVTPLKQETSGRFTASKCTLPFGPPNPVCSLDDSCLEDLMKQQENEEKFCLKLATLRKLVKSTKHFRERIMSLHDDLSKMNDSEIKAMPILPSVLDLANNFPSTVPSKKANWLYTGGCLSYCSWLNGASGSNIAGVLLRPGGLKFNTLVVSPLVEADRFSHFSSPENLQTHLKLKGGTIYQVESCHADRDYCLVRQNRRCHLVVLNEDGNGLPCPSHCETYKATDPLTCASLSPHIEGEYIFMTNKGQVTLRNAATERTAWECAPPLLCDTSTDSKWWSCGFGSHPRCIIFADRQFLSMKDIRLYKHEQPLQLLNSDSQFLLQKEQIITFKQHPLNPFQTFVATDYHVLVCDERFPHQPLISWNHMLDCFPTSCDVAQIFSGNDQELLAVISSQIPREVTCIHLKCQPSIKVQPASLSAPWLASSPSDIVRALRIHGGNVDDSIARRVNMPVIGACCVPHKEEGFTIFQLTSLCDVYFQDYSLGLGAKDKTFRVDAGCSFSSPESVLSEMNWWFDLAKVEQACDDDMEKLLKRIDCSAQISTTRQVRQQARDCILCHGAGVDTVNSVICPSCGLDTVSSLHIWQEMSKGAVLASHLPSSQQEQETEPLETALGKLQLVDLKKPWSSLSGSLLDVWLTEDGEPINQTRKEYATSDSEGEILRSILVPHDPASRSESEGEVTVIEEVLKRKSEVGLLQDRDKHSILQLASQDLSLAKPSAISLSGNVSIPQTCLPVEEINLSDDEVIPPSQDVQFLGGETIRTPRRPLRKPGSKLSEKLSATAGF